MLFRSVEGSVLSDFAKKKRKLFDHVADVTSIIAFWASGSV